MDLVTGATGFIGQRLVERLLADGRRVKALVLPSERIHGLWPPGAVEEERGDVSDPAACDRAARGVETVFHLAAVVGDWGEEALFRRVTVEGTGNVLGAAARAGARAVVASSVVVYGDAVGRDVCPEEHSFGRPLGPYSRSKQAQELLAFRIAAATGLPVTALRLGNVYGPGSRPWVDEVVAQLRAGTPALVDGGDRDAGLCHVESAAEAFMLAARTPAAAGRAYNVNDASGVTWRRYFGDLARLADARSPRSIPLAAARLGAGLSEAAWRALRRPGRPPITHEALNLIGSSHRVPIDRARRELGFAPAVRYENALDGIAADLGTR